MFRQLASRSWHNCSPAFRNSKNLGLRNVHTSNNLNRLEQKSRLPRLFAIFGGVAGTCYLIDEYYLQSLLQRSVRAISVLSYVAYRYSTASSITEIQAFHEQGAKSIFDMLAANKGLYIKLGQAIANQGAVFPVAYQKHFVNLYDAAPVDSWDLVDRLLRQSLGSNYEKEVFEYIEHNPIASALIAQVHKAKLKLNGDVVAVKVQHPYIAKQMPVDLRVYRLMSWVYSKVFDIPLTFITKYVAEQMFKETNFVTEAANSERLASLLANDPHVQNLDIYVPECYKDLSSKKILITEWIEGISLTDKEKLIDNSYSLPRVMYQYITVFARQIFEYGFVHSDPHPGNLLVRKIGGRQQLVILDHGLYISLPEKFRQEYSELWEAMFNMDQKKVNQVSAEWGVGSSEFLRGMAQLRPPTNMGKVPNAIELMRELLSDLTKFPPDLMFIMRTMRMIQNLNQTMGSPVNRINVLTKSAIYLVTDRREFTLKNWFISIKSRFFIFISETVFLFLRARQILLGDKYGGKGEGMEDFIEEHIRESAKSMGFEIVDGL